MMLAMRLMAASCMHTPPAAYILVAHSARLRCQHTNSQIWNHSTMGVPVYSTKICLEDGSPHINHRNRGAPSTNIVFGLEIRVPNFVLSVVLLRRQVRICSQLLLNACLRIGLAGRFRHELSWSRIYEQSRVDSSKPCD